jgi:hypothetical protein
MGSAVYEHVVKYNADINVALQELREREFRAGRYYPVIEYPFDLLPIGPHSPAPGAQHATMEDASLASEADGTRSIIDIESVSNEAGFGRAVPLGDDVSREVFGTTRPTRAMVEAKGYMLLYEVEKLYKLQRGRAIYIVLYKNDQPDEIYFAGRTID